jgi:hypothetical protein
LGAKVELVVPESRPRTTGDPVPSPPWIALVLVSAAFGGLTAIGVSPRTALYWYIFPLFGIGACYLVQFRRQFSRWWVAVFAGTTVLSAVALGLEWAFSGHVLWNVLFIGHAWMTGKRRSAWMALLVASLVYLFVMKVVSQTTRDVVGGFISIAVAIVLLLLIQWVDGVHPRHR